MAFERFAIFGAGGFGRELVRPAAAMLATRTRETGLSQQLIFAGDDTEIEIAGVPHVQTNELTHSDEVIIAVGDSGQRKDLSERMNVRFGQLIAPTALIGPNVQLGEGAVFCDFTTVTASARIGRHFQCNIYSYVAHDCVIGDFVTFAPRVCCNGNVYIEDNVYVGTGAVIRQGRSEKPLLIGKGAIIGMGAVVTKDVAAGAVVVGNPARPLDRN